MAEEQQLHTITCGLILVVGIAWTSQSDSGGNHDIALSEPIANQPFSPNVLRGCVCACLFFLLYSALQLGDARPGKLHPLLRLAGRVVSGCAILYEMLLLLLTFQATPEARGAVRMLDPGLGSEPPGERSYGELCGLGAFFAGALFDRFVLAHFLGWWVIALQIRSTAVCWLVSVGFELCELSLRAWLPNFVECWFDSVVLDLLVCNGAGIAVGAATRRWLGIPPYDWLGGAECVAAGAISSSSASKRGYFCSHDGRDGNALLDKSSPPRFPPLVSPVPPPQSHLPLPQQRRRLPWVPVPACGLRRVLCLLALICHLLVTMLNGFFLKAALWVDAASRLNVWRLLLWGPLGLLGVAEYHDFVHGSTASAGRRKLGQNAWLAIVIAATEAVVAARHAQGQPWRLGALPAAVRWGWPAAFAAGTAWLACVWAESTAGAAKAVAELARTDTALEEAAAVVVAMGSCLRRCKCGWGCAATAAGAAAPSGGCGGGCNVGGSLGGRGGGNTSKDGEQGTRLAAFTRVRSGFHGHDEGGVCVPEIT